MSAGALAYLIGRTARNRIRRYAARLRQPRYAAAIVLGGGYLLLIANNNRSASRYDGGMVSEAMPVFLMLGVAAFVAWAWTIARPRQALIFSLSEVAFLFPAPLTRRAVLQFKLARTQLLIVLNVVLWLFIAGRPAALPLWMRAVAIWSVFTTLSLHKIGAAFVRTSLAEHGAHGVRRRQLVIGALVAVGALAVAAGVQVAVGLAAIGPGAGLWQALRTQLGEPIPAAALAPFWAVARPLEVASPAEWWQAMLPALGILALHYVWVLRSDTAFEESAAEASLDHAAALRNRRLGHRFGGSRRYSAPLFGLGAVGSPGVALVWKNLTMVLRRGQLRLWGVAVGGSLFGMTLLSAAAPSIGEALGVMLLVWGGFLFLLGPQWIRNDLRSDLGQLDLLRTFPVRGDALIRAEAAGAALVLTLGQAALMAVGFAGIALTSELEPGRRWLGLSVALIMLPTLNYAGMILQNGAALLFPAWVNISGNRGIESLGQHMLGALAYLLALLVVMLPATLLGAGVYAVTRHSVGDTAVAAAAVVASLVIVLESWLLSLWLGVAFTRMDPPSAGVTSE